jgi:hypothetical protein
MRRALYVAAFDSQLKWCGRIRNELESRGFATEVVVPDTRSALSPGQIADAGFAGVQTVSWAELTERALAADAVVCSLSGPNTRALLFDLADRLEGVEGPGPVVVSGWVGIIIEKITAGYLDRCGSDVVAANSVEDLEHFLEAARALSLPTDNLLLAGLPFLSGEPDPPRLTVKRMLFADQPTVPSTEAERRLLYAGAVAYARAHPEREVILKPRHRPEEDTFHRMRHHPEVLLANMDLPANFTVDYTSVAELLPTVDLLVTVSSTACLEALDRGCRVALLLDLGVHERYGNQVFLHSGLLRTWEEITADRLGSPRPEWLATYFFPRHRTATQTIADRVEELVDSGHRPSRDTWRSAYYRSAAAAHRALAEPVGESPLARRRRRQGLVRGTVAHLAPDLVPPLLWRGVARTRARLQGWRR